MAQKPFIFTMNTPVNSGSNVRLDMGVSYIDSTDQEYFVESIIADVSATGLSTVRAQMRDAVKTAGENLHEFSLGNDDVFFPDFSRELL